MSGEDIFPELRGWRDEFARSHGYDLGAMVAMLRELDGATGARVVRGEPRRPAAVPPKEAVTPIPSLRRTPAAGRESGARTASGAAGSTELGR